MNHYLGYTSNHWPLSYPVRSIAVFMYIYIFTHDRGSTRSAAARRRGDDRFESRADTAAMSGARHE